MHVFGLSLDLNLFLQFVFTAFVATFGLFHIVKNTASKYFEFDGGGEYRGIMSEEAICIVCGQPGSKKCSRCKSVRYCSPACQAKDWNAGHKNKCKTLKVSSVGRNSDGIALVPVREGDSKIIKQTKKILFPYDEFIKLFNWEKPLFPPCGLINCGNSCFANVVLQCLSFTRPLVAYLLERGHRRECKRNDWCFLCEFQLHLERASRSAQPFSPINILSRLPNIGGNLGHGRQEDAHEFMRFAIDTMQSVCLDEFGGEKAVHPSSQETTLIQHIFGGHLQSQVMCTKCGRISKQYENMMDLTVEIHGDASSLEECLNQFTAKEWLQGENMYKCEGCNDYVKAWKRLTIHKAPNVLTIALKRFQSGRFGKLNKRVTFPDSLDLSPYMSEVGDGTDVYKLYAVVVHLDMLNASFFGHYICYAKDSRGNWFRIDDDEVASVDVEEVLSQRAYMLLYSRVSPRPSCLRAAEFAEEVGKEKVNIEPGLKEQDQISDVAVSASPVSDSEAPQSDTIMGVSNYEKVLPIINNSETNGQVKYNNVFNFTLEKSLAEESSRQEMDISIACESKASKEASEDMDVDSVTSSTLCTPAEISTHGKESGHTPMSGSATELSVDKCNDKGLEVARGGCKDAEKGSSNRSSGAVNGVEVYANGHATVDYIDLPVKETQNLISNSFCRSTQKSAS